MPRTRISVANSRELSRTLANSRDLVVNPLGANPLSRTRVSSLRRILRKSFKKLWPRILRTSGSASPCIFLACFRLRVRLYHPCVTQLPTKLQEEPWRCRCRWRAALVAAGAASPAARERGPARSHSQVASARATAHSATGSSRARSTPRPRRASGRCDGERCGVCLCLSAVVVYAVYRYIPDHSPEYHAHTHGKTYGIISWMHCRFTRHGTRVQGVRFDGGAHGLPRLHVNARAPPPRLSHPGAVQMGASGGGTARIMVLGLSQAFACRAAARLLIATCLSTSADDVSRHLLDCPPPSPPRHTCMQHTWSIESHHSRT